MSIIHRISNAIINHSNKEAFFINGQSYSYNNLASKISSIRALLKRNTQDTNLHIGLAAYDDLETYAAIFAIWLEGKAYIPINPNAPVERNSYILQQANSTTILSSNTLPLYSNQFQVINTAQIINTPINLEVKHVPETHLAYILFTSGSTGQPKGVPISFENLTHLIQNIDFDKNHSIYPTDKCLQMFDLTFDFSVVTYLYPILHGASVYTIPKNQIKYFYIYKLITKHHLSYLVMVPSIIHYLKPYFEEIHATHIRYCCFGAAALHIDIFEHWQKCLPNAKFYNSYGPTEYTVTTSYYAFEDNKKHRTKNGVVSIGKPMNNVTAIVIDENLNIVPANTPGELCLAGKQLTTGYLNNDNKNATEFFYKTINNETLRFYKTGDICYQDNDGYLLFIERKDFQVKIRGYRVELSEVEFHVKQHITDTITNVAAIDITNTLGNTELALVIESTPFNTKPLLKQLENKLPDYMIPTHVTFLDTLPHNTNGKIDRKKIKTLFNT